MNTPSENERNSQKDISTNDKPRDLSLSFEVIGPCNELFESYSKLMTGMEEWAIMDYFYQKAGTSKLKRAFVDLWAPPNILGARKITRNLAIRRVRRFLDDITKILEYYKLYKLGKDQEIDSIGTFIEEYRKLVPEIPKGLTSYQMAPIISAVAAIFLLGINLLITLDPTRFSLNFFLALTLLFGGLGAATYTATGIAYAIREYIWYRFLVKSFGITKKERAVSRVFRKMTRQITDDLYKDINKKDKKSP